MVIVIIKYLTSLNFSGPENSVSKENSDDGDSGKVSMISYGSMNSLNSQTSASNTGLSRISDNPEQFEVVKQQKEIWEQGIHM